MKMHDLIAVAGRYVQGLNQHFMSDVHQLLELTIAPSLDQIKPKKWH